MKYLVQLPTDASTSKFPKTFPQPTNLACLYSKGDQIIDLALFSYKKKKQQIEKEILNTIGKLQHEKNQVIVNAGDFPADAAFDKYFRYYFDHNNRKISVIGSYPKVKFKELQFAYRKNITFLNDFEYSNPDYSVMRYSNYPRVNGKIKANIRHTYGCPRKCLMCPVPICFKNKFSFNNYKVTAAIIQELYNQGIKYFTFIDDNLDIAPNFGALLRRLKKKKLKGVQYHCQEGFDVACFNEEIAELLKELRFDNIKIAFENVNSNFLKKIKKSHVTREKIERVIEIAKKYDINIGTFFLIGLDETEDDILENLKFFAKHKLSIRANIIRDYGDFFKKTGIERRYPDSVYKKYKTLAYTVNFFNSLNINIFKGADELTQAGYKVYADRIEGKTKFGFRTNYFEKGIEYMLPDYEVKKNTGNIIHLRKRQKGFFS